MTAQGLKRCPTCRHMVAKTDGCNAVTCRCGIVFCFVCSRRVQTQGLSAATVAGSEFCNCNDWGVNAHRNMLAGPALGAGVPDRVAPPQVRFGRHIL